MQNYKRQVILPNWIVLMFFHMDVTGRKNSLCKQTVNVVCKETVSNIKNIVICIYIALKVSYMQLMNWNVYVNKGIADDYAIPQLQDAPLSRGITKCYHLLPDGRSHLNP